MILFYILRPKKEKVNNNGTIFVVVVILFVEHFNWLDKEELFNFHSASSSEGWKVLFGISVDDSKGRGKECYVTFHCTISNDEIINGVNDISMYTISNDEINNRVCDISMYSIPIDEMKNGILAFDILMHAITNDETKSKIGHHPTAKRRNVRLSILCKLKI